MTKPNILLILIDSFNVRKFQSKDKTSKTPNIEKLIKNGTIFTQATSCADATLLSTTGLFTSKFPFKTGIRSPNKNKLNENIKTNLEILQENGYNLYSFRPTLQENDDLFPKFTNEDALYDVFKNLSDGLGNQVIGSLKNMKEPWFFFVHPHDLHQPIIVTKEFNNKKYGSNNYEKQISAVDFWLGKIFEKVNFTNTLVILSADHGSFVKTPIKNTKLSIEADGKSQLMLSKISNKMPSFVEPLKKKLFFYLENEKKKKREEIVNSMNLSPNDKRNLLAGRFTKNHTLYDDQIRIPLVISGIGIKKGKAITQQVRNIDIFPTIFDLISISNTNDYDGISLKPLLDDRKIEENPIFLESNPLVEINSNDVIGIRTSEYKFFRDKLDSTKRKYLFDRKNDPLENENISSNSEEIIKNMEIVLSKITKKFFVNKKF